VAWTTFALSYAKFEVLTVVLLKIQVCCQVEMCCLVCAILGLPDHEDKGTMLFKIPQSAHAVMRWHIPEDLDFLLTLLSGGRSNEM
jgi:hypothetical protein